MRYFSGTALSGPLAVRQADTLPLAKLRFYHCGKAWYDSFNKGGLFDAGNIFKENAMITVTCPSCHESFEVPDSLAGQPEKCPACGKVIRIPTFKRKNSKQGFSPAMKWAAAGFAALALLGIGLCFSKLTGHAVQNPSGPVTAAPMPPAEAKKILMLLQRFEAKTEAGMQFPDYTKQMGELWADVKAFDSSDDAGFSPKLTAAILETANFYKKGGDAWNEMLNPTGPEAYQEGIPGERARLDAEQRNEWRRQFYWQMASNSIAKATRLAKDAKANMEDLDNKQRQLETDLAKKIAEVAATRKAAESADEKAVVDRCRKDWPVEKKACLDTYGHKLDEAINKVDRAMETGNSKAIVKAQQELNEAMTKVVK